MAVVTVAEGVADNLGNILLQLAAVPVVVISMTPAQVHAFESHVAQRMNMLRQIQAAAAASSATTVRCMGS